MSEARPPTPSSVERALRQAARFGCCVCGCPVYQYHHIIPFSIEEHFRPEDMMILCPLHHDQATKGALTLEEQRAYQKSPFNVVRGYASGRLKINQSACVVKIGSALLVGSGPLLCMDGEPLLSLTIGEQRNMELSATLFNESNDTMAVIDRNEWVSGDTSAWDIESDHQLLRVRERHGRVSIEVDVRKMVTTVRAHLYYNSNEYRLRPSGIHLYAKKHWRNSFQDLAFVGQSFNFDSQENELTLIPYLGRGFLVPDKDESARISRALSSWNECLGNSEEQTP